MTSFTWIFHVAGFSSVNVHVLVKSPQSFRTVWNAIITQTSSKPLIIANNSGSVLHSGCLVTAGTAKLNCFNTFLSQILAGGSHRLQINPPRWDKDLLSGCHILGLFSSAHAHYSRLILYEDSSAWRADKNVPQFYIYSYQKPRLTCLQLLHCCFITFIPFLFIKASWLLKILQTLTGNFIRQRPTARWNF